MAQPLLLATGMTTAPLRQRLSDLPRIPRERCLDQLLTLLMEDSEADAVLAFELASTPEGPRLVSWHQQTRDAELGEQLHDWRKGAQPDQWPDFTRPTKRCLRGFMQLESGRPPFSVVAMPAFPDKAQHILRCLVYERGVFVGWIGAFRCQSRPFSRRVVTRWRENSDRGRQILTRDAWALQQGANGQIIVDTEGKVLFATAEGHRWLRGEEVQDSLRETVVNRNEGQIPSETWIGGAHVRFTPATGPDSNGFWAEVVPAPPVRQARDSVLTPMQRQVAHYAAAGATTQEIARTLGAAVETVRTHLREIYRRLEVASRVELAELLRDAPMPSAALT